MSFSCLLTFLNQSTPAWQSSLNSIADYVSVIAALGGFFCFLSAFVPHFCWIAKTKCTLGLNKMMFLLHTTVGFLFLIGSLALIVLGQNISNWAMIANGVIFSVLNLSSFYISLVTVVQKWENVRAATKLGISEAEYYEQHIKPTLK